MCIRDRYMAIIFKPRNIDITILSSELRDVEQTFWSAIPVSYTHLSFPFLRSIGCGNQTITSQNIFQTISFKSTFHYQQPQSHILSLIHIWLPECAAMLLHREVRCRHAAPLLPAVPTYRLFSAVLGMSSLIFSLPAIFIRNTFCPLSSAVDIGSVLRMMICSRCSIWDVYKRQEIW